MVVRGQVSSTLSVRVTSNALWFCLVCFGIALSATHVLLLGWQGQCPPRYPIALTPAAIVNLDTVVGAMWNS